MELNAKEFGTSAKAKDLMRQQYLVPRKSVKRLREMSRREGVSAGELVRRAIEAYTSGKVLTEPEEEVTSRSVVKDIHTQVRSVLTRFDAHPEKAQGIVELFASQATA
jgi:Ribbon-helix-helix protein, copG family